MAEERNYDVVLSFAGEDRRFAEDLYSQLKQRNVRVFYDNNEQSILWGKNLYDYLTDLYLNRAKFCVMIVSKYYAQKLWTNHERRVVQARAFRENQEYILPVKLDDTEIPGILSTIGYLSCPPEDAKSISEKIILKLNTIGDSHGEVTETQQPQISEQLVFKRDDSSIVKINKKSVVRRSILTILGSSITGIYIIVWFFAAHILADSPSNILASYTFASLSILIILVIVSVVLLIKNEDYLSLYNYKEPTGRMGKHIAQDRFAKKDVDGNYIMYKMFMPCTYTACDGIAYISNAPTGHKKFFTGSCTLDPNTHTYTVDANGLAVKAGIRVY
jgi:hypothetical protein